MSDLAVIGRGVPKRDGADKVTGRTRFLHDLEPPRLAHGKILRSRQPHARLLRIDTSRAAALPGVLAVITGADVEQHPFGFVKDQLALKTGKVRCVRDEIAAVAAESPALAEEALTLIDVEYAELLAVFDPLAAVRPEIMGVIALNGAPLSYWAGSAKQNPMRYAGGMLGGSWLASFVSDLAGDRFDGANLVANFEGLNPANTYWTKYYNLYSNIDTEAPRFLEFERWWGGFFRMTGQEIGGIVDNLFVGNRLARGEVAKGEVMVDLRNITAPVVVFA